MTEEESNDKHNAQLYKAVQANQLRPESYCNYISVIKGEPGSTSCAILRFLSVIAIVITSLGVCFLPYFCSIENGIFFIAVIIQAFFSALLMFVLTSIAENLIIIRKNTMPKQIGDPPSAELDDSVTDSKNL